MAAVVALAATLGAAPTASAGTIVFDRSRHDAELDRTRAAIWAIDDDGSNRRLLASTAGNADVKEHGPSEGYVSYREPSVTRTGRTVVFEAGAVGHSATACGGPFYTCAVHFGFNVDGARLWRDGRLRDLTPRPRYCFNCTTFYEHPEQTAGGRWVGWYTHFQSGDLAFSAYVSRWALGRLGGSPRLRDAPCPGSSDRGPFAAHPTRARTVAFVACGPGLYEGPWGVFVANRDGGGVRQVASLHVDDERPALAWTASGRGLIARAFVDGDPDQSGLYLLDPAVAPDAQDPQPILHEPAGVQLQSPTAVGRGRIAFSARQGGGDDATTDLWSIPASCRGCGFPARARRLTRDGVSANPDWTATEGLGLAAVRSPKPRVQRNRVVLAVACPAGGRACRGRLALRTAGKVKLGSRRRRATLARGRYRVPAGRTRRVATKLTRAGRTLARRRSQTRATVQLRPAGGGRSTSSVTLRS